MGRCLMRHRAGHKCSGPVDPHHVLPKQFLKGAFSTFAEEEKWWHVHNPDNGVPLCRAAHDAVTTKMGYIFREELPARVIDFAEAHGLGWRLERECPPLMAEAFGERQTPEQHVETCDIDEDCRCDG